MDIYNNLELLARAFAYGEIDAVADAMNENCKYNSDYGHKRLTSAEQILENMRKVNEYVMKETAEGNDCTYSYKIVKLEDYFKPGISLSSLRKRSLYDVFGYGMLLYQSDDEAPVSIVYIKYNPGGQITEINLSRNYQFFDIVFSGDDPREDSEKDIPYTVMPLSPHDIQVSEMQNAFTFQKREYTELDDSEVYIWRQSDKYFKRWLEENGFHLIETQIFDDCIGYRCHRNGYAYTVYMFAFGKMRTTQLDGDYCQKLMKNKLSEKSFVLVVYLNVKRTTEGKNTSYHVMHYSGEESQHIELWRVNEVSGKPILEFFPGLEMIEMTWRLMYAFNHDDQDVYDCIISDHNPGYNGLEYEGTFMNAAFFNSMYRLHKEHGNMKLGYVRYNDVVYSGTPYLDGYGFFGFSVNNVTGKIQEVTAHPFDGKYKEFIKAGIKEDEDWYDSIPDAIEVQPLKPVYTEKFAVKLTFNNGECRKYILPIDFSSENDEVVSYDRHVFTDKIWKSVALVDGKEPYFRKALRFANGYTISTLKCYENGEIYSEPEMDSAIVYMDDKCKIERCWKWDVKAMYEDEETGLLKTLINGNAFNYNGKSTFASAQGERLCSINFDYIGSFSEGLAIVCKSEYGYGFINEKMQIAIPMIYQDAEDFHDGRAKVYRDSTWFLIDPTGKETKIRDKDEKYQAVGNYYEGMCRVSTLRLGFMDLAYHSDYSEIAGIWGFINEAGEEVISPQYIYANDFENGIAIVCKGEWTIDIKWDNEYNSGRYWTEEELWGGIDKKGNEVIPFVFDEIKDFWTEESVYMAHFGGWEEGKWGVIDDHGNWLAEPIFEDIDYEYQDGLFAFYEKDKWEDDVLMGIYDLKQKRILFEPQFTDVSFYEDGWIKVEVYDEQLGRKIEKLIDKDGKEKFYSIYTSIDAWKKPYEVMICDKHGTRRYGLIDENGTVILPCEHEISFNGIDYERKTIIFEKDGKQGIKDFSGNIIIAPEYHKIQRVGEHLFIAQVGDNDNFKEGIINRNGRIIIPAKYNLITCVGNNGFICRYDGGCEVYKYIEQKG